MAMSEAHNRATRKYQAAHIDQIRFDAPRGFKERIRAAAQALGVSPSQLMRDAVRKVVDDVLGEEEKQG